MRIYFSLFSIFFSLSVSAADPYREAQEIANRAPEWLRENCSQCRSAPRYANPCDSAGVCRRVLAGTDINFPVGNGRIFAEIDKIEESTFGSNTITLDMIRTTKQYLTHPTPNHVTLASSSADRSAQLRGICRGLGPRWDVKDFQENNMTTFQLASPSTTNKKYENVLGTITCVRKLVTLDSITQFLEGANPVRGNQRFDGDRSPGKDVPPQRSPSTNQAQGARQN
jgi:hypothetical protein